MVQLKFVITFNSFQLVIEEETVRKEAMPVSLYLQ